MVQFDLDELIDRVGGRRTAVVTGPAGFLSGLGGFAEFATRALPVRGFLALEHGLRGELQDGVRFDRYMDPRSGLPVFSFYGSTPTFPEAFLREEVDVVVFHVQDVSHRAYTYKQALAATLEAAARTRTAVIVLDRPTPLAHLGAWGPLHAQFFPLPLPVGIPLTLGELALFLREKKGIEVDLAVIPAGNWDRGLRWADTGLPWVPPSPNVPSVDAVYAYACTGIVQATNVSEGRGTCKPFEYVGAPFVEAPALAAELNASGLPGVLFREVWFQPGFNKYAGEICAGVHLIFTDAAALGPLRTQLHLLRSLARLCPERFELKPGFGHWLDGGTWTVERVRCLDIPEYMARASAAAAAFMDVAECARLYEGH